MAKRSPIYGYTRRSRIGWPQWIGSRWSISTLANCKLTGHQSTLVDTGDSRRRSSLPIRDGRSPVPLFAPVRHTTFSTKVQRPALAALLLGRRNLPPEDEIIKKVEPFPTLWRWSVGDRRVKWKTRLGPSVSSSFSSSSSSFFFFFFLRDVDECRGSITSWFASIALERDRMGVLPLSNSSMNFPSRGAKIIIEATGSNNISSYNSRTLLRAVRLLEKQRSVHYDQLLYLDI